jgi:hypothetical protein
MRSCDKEEKGNPSVESEGASRESRRDWVEGSEIFLGRSGFLSTVPGLFRVSGLEWHGLEGWAFGTQLRVGFAAREQNFLECPSRLQWMQRMLDLQARRG